MRAAKARNRIESGAPQSAPVQRPRLARIIVVIDYATGSPRVRMMQLWNTGRRRSHRVVTPRGVGKKPIGWSRALAIVRKAVPA
jgi:hypothetical protein